MKRVVKFISAILLLAMFAMACSNYICPAYSEDNSSEQAGDVERS